MAANLIFMYRLTLSLLFFLIFHQEFSYGQNNNLDSVRMILEGIFKADQDPRKAIDSIGTTYGFNSKQMKDHWQKILASDSINIQLVGAILDRYGWLGTEDVSGNGNHALFLVIQHADPETQKRYLPYLKAAVKNGKAKASELALLTDRIKTNQGKYQIYGTQFQSDAEGRMYLYPVEDEPSVDNRRKEVGLESLEMYARKAGVQYHLPKKNLYKNKIVLYCTVADTQQKRFAAAEVYLGTKFLAKTNYNGEFNAVIDKKDRKKELVFKKQGYQSFYTHLIGNKDVYTDWFLLAKE